MSRGLSKNQRRILGIAYGVNLATVGGKVKAGAPVDRYNVPTVDYVGIKDVNWNIAAHLVYELAFVNPGEKIYKRNSHYPVEAGGVFDMRSKKAKAAKAGTVRAITSLCKSGYLVLAPKDSPFMRWGYVLTEKGFELGKQYAESVSDWLIYRAGLSIYLSGSGCVALRRIPDLLAAGTLTLSSLIEESRNHKATTESRTELDTCQFFNNYELPTSHKWEDGNSYQQCKLTQAVTDKKALPTFTECNDGNGYLIDGCAEVVEVAK